VKLKRFYLPSEKLNGQNVLMIFLQSPSPNH
jgi:hypothetical protein